MSKMTAQEKVKTLNMDRVAMVQFPARYDKDRFTNSLYSYLTDDPTLKSGDLVVVPTQYGYSVAKIHSLSKNESQFAKTYIVSKVDIDTYEQENKKREQTKQAISEYLELAEQRETFVAQIEATQQDPLFAALLGYINEIQGGKY